MSHNREHPLHTLVADRLPVDWQATASGRFASKGFLPTPVHQIVAARCVVEAVPSPYRSPSRFHSEDRPRAGELIAFESLVFGEYALLPGEI